MSDKLGFTFYPKDWWTSDTFFEFNPEERYIYLECLFIMYQNEGYLKTQKTQLENRIRTQISDEVFYKITSKFVNTEFGFTHESVNKRLRKTIANRENGKKGGRPKETQKTQKNNPKKPTLEREREREREKKYIKPTIEEIKIYCEERKNNIQPGKFFDYYESKGWMIGKNKMKDWKAAIRTWENNTEQTQEKQNKPQTTSIKFD